MTGHSPAGAVDGGQVGANKGTNIGMTSGALRGRRCSGRRPERRARLWRLGTGLASAAARACRAKRTARPDNCAPCLCPIRVCLHLPAPSPWSFPSPCPYPVGATRSWRRCASTRSSSLCGETGSGKTTQLPKICAGAGAWQVQCPGQKGQLIGHTQPRRIAASSVAKRIAEELKTPLGEVVGYKVRFQGPAFARRLGQTDDRRHSARRDSEGSPAAARPTTPSSSTRPTNAA
jgi:hypothetical protein